MSDDLHNTGKIHLDTGKIDTGKIDTGHLNTDSMETGKIHLDAVPSDQTGQINLADIRREYVKSGIRKTDMHVDPIVQFDHWMKDALASGNREPTAVALATATADGRPAVRMVLLKGFDARGFRFFTDYESRKGQELSANPKASMCFFWPELERQVRVEGVVERASRQESEQYFSSRPAGSQISAAASPQSRAVADREELESRRREVENRFAGRPVELPDNWGGFWLWPDTIEFWQGRADRLHDRMRYRRPVGSDDWQLDRLAP